jgi:hypothetical protein
MGWCVGMAAQSKKLWDGGKREEECKAGRSIYCTLRGWHLLGPWWVLERLRAFIRKCLHTQGGLCFGRAQTRLNKAGPIKHSFQGTEAANQGKSANGHLSLLDPSSQQSSHLRHSSHHRMR